MAIEQMLLLNMTFDRDRLSNMLVHLKNSQDFYLQPSNKIIKQVKDVQELTVDSTYQRVLDKFNTLSKDIKLSLDNDFTHSHELNIEQVENYVDEQIAQVKKINDIKNEIIKEKKENETTLAMLNHLNFKEVDLDNLKNCRFVTARFGRMRPRYVSGLNYYNGKPFLFSQLGKDKNYVWCCYIAVNNSLVEIDNIFKSLDFEEIVIPSFVHGTMDQAKAELQAEIDAMNEYILRMDQKISVLRETQKIDILKMYSALKYYNEVEQYKLNIVDYKDKYAVYGFISKRLIKQIKAEFNDIKSIEYHELPAHILEDQEVIAPKVVYNPFWAQPFVRFSHVSQNDSIDTTCAIAVLFYCISLLLLGDLGIGVALLLVGILTRKSQRHLCLALGIALFIGGLLSGSVFYGYSLFHGLFTIGVIQRLINGIVLLVSGLFSISCVKEMYNQSLMNKIFSLKGICGNVVIYTLLIYLLGTFEVHLHISFTPVLIVLTICFASIILRTVLYKRIERRRLWQ